MRRSAVEFDSTSVGSHESAVRITQRPLRVDRGQMMAAKKAPADFLKWLQGQLKAFRHRRFEQIEVETLGDELEGVVGRCRGEVGERAIRVNEILMRGEYVYGDWHDLTGEWDMLREAIEDSPSLAKTAAARVKRAYESPRLKAEVHGEGRWPARCPRPTLEALGRAVRGRDREYLALE